MILYFFFLLYNYLINFNYSMCYHKLAIQLHNNQNIKSSAKHYLMWTKISVPRGKQVRNLKLKLNFPPEMPMVETVRHISKYE